MSGTKAIFMLKVREKHSDGREEKKDYIHALRIDSNVTHEETKNFITAAELFESNHKHFMLFTELHICHKISENNSHPLQYG